MSNLINKTGLQKFATKLWAKIKDRYDNAFVDAEIPTAEKKIKFTKAGRWQYHLLQRKSGESLSCG